MSSFEVLTIIVVVGALFSYINYKLLRLPTTIGVTLLVLAASILLIALGAVYAPIDPFAARLVERLDFSALVLNGMLALLLFAGALDVARDFQELLAQRWSVVVLATIGVVASTILVGGATWLLSAALDAGLEPTECLLFGALISPTDPIAVLAMLRSASVPKAIEVQMAGEALFNDAIGVVTFSVILSLATASGHGPPTLATVSGLLARAVAGSVALGLGVGWVAFRMLRAVDNYQVEVLLTLALALGLYVLATALGTSGPLAVIVAGLIVGGVGRAQAMSASTVEHVDMFWELVNEILNVVLFASIGLEAIAVHLTPGLLLLGVAAACLTLLVRLVTVAGAALALRRVLPFERHAVKLLTWGGLRGGLSLAMALSLGPDIAGRHTIQAITYVAALFSIAVQGLTFPRLVRWTANRSTP
jgi:CPA1 family monovalent cation:H+ antiporter